jgi:hypothetical protein
MLTEPNLPVSIERRTPLPPIQQQKAHQDANDEQNTEYQENSMMTHETTVIANDEPVEDNNFYLYASSSKKDNQDNMNLADNSNIMEESKTTERAHSETTYNADNSSDKEATHSYEYLENL